MKKEKRIFLTGAILLCTGMANAQTDTLRLLDEVIVSATRSEKNAANVPRSVTVITSEELRSGIYQNVGEVLNAQEGIYVVGAQQNAGMNQTVFTRGTNSNHTVIMIDGVRITDPSGVNNAPDLSEISISNVERIEIVRGSHSTMYGSSAIGGVINIITKTPKTGFSTDVNLYGGTFGKNTSMHTENVYLNYMHEKGFFIGGEIFNQGVKGFDATTDTITNDTVKKLFDTDNFSKLDFNVKAGYKTEKTYAYVSFKNVAQKTDIDKMNSGTSKYFAYPDTYYDGNYTLDFKRMLLTYGAEHKLNEKATVKYYGGYSEVERISVSDSTELSPGVYDKEYSWGKYNGKILSNELQFAYAAKGAVITGGVSHYNETMNSQTKSVFYFSPQYYISESNLDTVNPEATTIGGYLQTELNGSLINDKLNYLNIITGIRYNNHNLFGNYYTYSVNPSVKINENSVLFFTWSTGFNAPSLYQLYSPEAHYLSGITRGNPNLKPEISRSLELGFKKKFSDQLTAGFSIFSNRVENSIEYVYLWNKNIDVDSVGLFDNYGDTYLNIGTLTANGAEISINGKINEKFSVNANLSLIYGKTEYNKENIDLDHTDSNHVQVFSNGQFITGETSVGILVRRPSTANIGFTWSPVKELSFSFQARFTDNRYDLSYNMFKGPYGSMDAVPVNSYTLFDFSAGYKLKEKISFFFRAENITDVEYQQIYGFNTRGRSFYFGLRFAM